MVPPGGQPPSEARRCRAAPPPMTVGRVKAARRAWAGVPFGSRGPLIHTRGLRKRGRASALAPYGRLRRGARGPMRRVRNLQPNGPPCSPSTSSSWPSSPSSWWWCSSPCTATTKSTELARLAPAAYRTRLTLPQVRLLDDPQVAHRHRLGVLGAGHDVPDAVTLDVGRPIVTPARRLPARHGLPKPARTSPLSPSTKNIPDWGPVVVSHSISHTALAVLPSPKHGRASMHVAVPNSA